MRIGSHSVKIATPQCHTKTILNKRTSNQARKQVTNNKGKMGKITVFLDKIINLVDTDLIGKADPYVVLQLEEDNILLDKNYGKKTSKKINGSNNPVYHETFVWDNVKSLNNLVLWIKVWDDDLGLDDKMGSCKIKLEDLGLSETPLGTDRVIDNNLIRKDSRIFIQISWHA